MICYRYVQASAVHIGIAVQRSRTDIRRRNVAVQLLLNTPMFVSWLATHDQVNCPYKELLGSEDCLACSLKHLAAGYWEHPRCTDAEFELRMTKFWDLCCEVFWGGRARRKRGGLLNPHEGGYEDEFLLYLIRELQEQSESVPSCVHGSIGRYRC